MTFNTPLERLAWPFDRDTYRYSTNVQGAGTPTPTLAGSWGRAIVNVDAQYPAVMERRRRILAGEPGRIHMMPYMQPAVWDALLFVLQQLADSYPDTMTLSQTDGAYTWENRVLGVRQGFRFGDDRSLPVAPLAFLVSQIEEDVFLLAPREGHLFVDASAATFAGSWSTTFTLGMSFHDIHGPVPRIHGTGMVDRTERFLMTMAPGETVRRTNWSIYNEDELDASLESYHTRDPRRWTELAASGRYDELRLRVEVQHLIKLPMTDTVLFLIETQLARLGDIVTVPGWAHQMQSVLAELPDDMADYKGFLRYRPALLDWFRKHTAKDRTPGIPARADLPNHSGATV